MRKHARRCYNAVVKKCQVKEGRQGSTTHTRRKGGGGGRGWEELNHAMPKMPCRERGGEKRSDRAEVQVTGVAGIVVRKQKKDTQKRVGRSRKQKVQVWFHGSRCGGEGR